ncbi:DUF721 domain-containing protein [Halomonas dongshanensis]|uniref:DUF721 domain-containing protein n=1 Tax=Halomonas dongshanensis TaxID=2890835 RepID=A0ABT2EEY1_9GAMM|nr:DUF721 domain-containing protein [Halomonas dongshanensis]MCS2610044.1 DUF721 domain-containing protein [Halomonas dongshanensis]
MSIKVKRSRAQPIARLLNASAGPNTREGVGLLMRQSRLIEQAQQHLRAHLPEQMREYVHVGGFHSGRLTIISNQASWVTWLRFEQPRLLGLLHQLPGFERLEGLTFKVRPVRPVKTPPKVTRTLSSQAGQTLAECASDTDDPALKRALQRLASHAKKTED